jgi:hypothetical protein
VLKAKLPFMRLIIRLFCDISFEFIVHSAGLARISGGWLECNGSRTVGRQFEKEWKRICTQFFQQSLLKKQDLIHFHNSESKSAIYRLALFFKSHLSSNDTRKCLKAFLLFFLVENKKGSMIEERVKFSFITL